MKIKNVKLMLLGLLAMGASNVSAQTHTGTDKIIVDGYDYYYDSDALDEKGRSVNNVVYDLRTVTWKNYASKTATTKEATVIGVNASASNADVASITIPAEVQGDKGTYKVTWINVATWTTAQKKVEGVTTSLSFDLTNVWPGSFSDVAYKNFTKLTSLTIKEASPASAPANATKFDGSACLFKATLTTLDLTGSRINEIAANGLQGYTALTGFDFGTNINTVGANAFDGDYGISTLTIPATVVKIGANAFDNMYLAKTATTPAKGLTTLTINGADNTYDAKGVLQTSVIPAAFAGNQLLSSVTVGSATATSIASGAFSLAPVTSIDLSGATKLAAIAGAFDTGLALQNVKLYGSDMATLTSTDLDLSASQLSLKAITLPKKLTTIAQNFNDFLYLEEIDLSVTGVKAIPAGFFNISGKTWHGIRHLQDANAQYKDGSNYAYSDKSCAPRTAIYIDPALKTVKLNAETATIGTSAFNGCMNLATVTGLNQDKLTTIGASAFNGTALPALDLSAATNELFTTIPSFAFGNISTLATVTLPGQIDEIYPAAFANAESLTSINLEDLEGLGVLNPIFHEGVVDPTWTTWFDGTYTIIGTTNEVAIPITSLTLPEGLRRINPGALQLLDISEIVIPESVISIQEYALQGCIKLTSFEWNDAPQRSIANNAFRGDDHLQAVKMVTKSNTWATYTGLSITGTTSTGDAVDVIFKGNKKDVLTFTVNAEDYQSLLAQGWTEANLQFCTLTAEGASTFKFSEKSKTGEYYYKTYYNNGQATWFPADKFEVFGAVVEGSDVKLVPATVEGGYYKVANRWTLGDKAGVCVVRSKLLEAEYELKNADFNDISTMPTDNDLTVGFGVKPSRLSYQYILGVKGGVVAFYRITSGTINGVYINSSTPADRLNIVVDGEATAIQAIENAAENNAPIYNLNGMRVNKAGKGVYIQNGKKFVK